MITAPKGKPGLVDAFLETSNQPARDFSRHHSEIVNEEAKDRTSMYRAMNRKALVLAATLVLVAAVRAGSGAEIQRPESAHRTPVLMELFTSEGCSSCPPADKLLKKLDSEQPLSGADLIVLSEHVDYWNHDGWVDRYSSPELTKRQEEYASLLDSEVYTPQLVIDGRKQVVGSDRSAIEHAVQAYLPTRKIPVLVSARRDAGQIAVHIDVAAVGGNRPTAVYLVLASDQARSHVMRGENAGRDLEHVAVVLSLVKIGTVSAGSGMQKDVRSALPPLLRTGNLRVVVFAQDAASKSILGVGQDKL